MYSDSRNGMLCLGCDAVQRCPNCGNYSEHGDHWKLNSRLGLVACSGCGAEWYDAPRRVLEGLLKKHRRSSANCRRQHTTSLMGPKMARDQKKNSKRFQTMSNSTNELTTFEFIQLAGQLMRDRNCPPILLSGLTGLGKSDVVRQTVRDVSDGNASWKPKRDVPECGSLEVINDRGLVDLRVSLLEPSDLLGLPDLSGKIVRWVVPSQLPVIGQEDRFPARGVLFLDELTQAQPAMQNACFSLVLDRRCGPHQLLPGWSIIAACNCADENAHTFPMSAPLRNRFAHFRIRCSLEAFKQWAIPHDIDPRIIAFLNWNPASLHQATENPEESFPTPRSWVNASRVLRLFRDSHPAQAVAACIGPGTATMFMAFLELDSASDLKVDVSQVLRGKARPPKFTMESPDLAWAFTARITAAVQQSPERLATAIGFYCSPAWKEAREIGRTGLADLKYLVPLPEFSRALEPHLESCRKCYGGLL